MLIASVPLCRCWRRRWRSPGRSAVAAAASLVGLLILIVYYQALNFGDALAKRDLLAPQFGLWLPFVLLSDR